ncbi:MAG: hypothetical protein AAF660_08455 [Pseudomonadota bacterium]
MLIWADLPLAMLLLVGPANEPTDEDAEVETDMAFLEYLGSWDESDEDWLLFDAPEPDEDDAGEDADDGEETDDES